MATLRNDRGLAEFLRRVAGALGEDAINVSEETLARYGENTLPGPDVRPGAVVYPGSTAEVQTVVRAANENKVALFPISTGYNIGMGSRSPVHAGQVVVDLGKRMNRILEIDETLGYAAVEPGVTFRAMAEELVRRGNKFIISTTSGPPEGGMVGNALDKGAGYGPYFDHFGMSCGIEAVLGNGEIIRTGDGAMNRAELPNWHVSKYSFGPILDGLFAQSNFGIVTRLGVWLLPRPPAVRSFHFTYPDDDDLAGIIDICRALKLSNFVPTLFRVSNDLYLIGTEDTHPDYAATGGKTSIRDDQRKALQRKHGLGAWTVSGAFYGPSMAAMDGQVERVRALFAAGGKARYIPHEDAAALPPLKCAIDAFSGTPTTTELGLLKWRPGGGNTWCLPGTPMVGAVANEFHRLARRLYEKNGLDYTIMNVCGARFMRGLHVISFNRERADERARADRLYRELTDAFAERGIAVGRAPTQYYDLHMAKASPAFRAACEAIKRALDPNGIIAPGKYGIGG